MAKINSIAVSQEPPIHLDDAVGFLANSSDAFGWVGSILHVLENTPPDSIHFRSLLGAARHIADDFENLTDCWREDMASKGVTKDWSVAAGR